MTAMGILVSSDIIGYTMEGNKIVKAVLTATDTQTGAASFQIDKVKKIGGTVSGWGGFVTADTSALTVKGPISVPLASASGTVSQSNAQNYIIVTPSAASDGMVMRFLVFERAV